MNLNINKSVQSLQTLPNPKNIKCYQMLKKLNETNPNPWTSTQCYEILKILENEHMFKINPTHKQIIEIH